MPVTFQVVGNLADFGNEPRAGVKVRATASPGIKIGDEAVHSNQPETVVTDEDGAFALELVSLPGAWYRIHTPYSGALPTINLAGYVPDVDDPTTGTAFPPGTVIDVKDVANENPTPGYDVLAYLDDGALGAEADARAAADAALDGRVDVLEAVPVVLTSDPRLSDARTPTTHGHTLDETTDTATRLALTPAERAKLAATSGTNTGDQVLPTFTTLAGKPSTYPPTIGATGATAVAGNDPRLNDARTPLTHVHPTLEVTGLDTALTGKAATVHTHTASQVSDSTATGRALLTAADATAARASLSLGTAATTDATAYATAAQGTKADSAVQPARTITAGTGLTGGGSLAADRTLTADFGTGAGKVAQGNDTRFGQIAGVTVSGTAAANQVPVASSSTAAAWGGVPNELRGTGSPEGAVTASPGTYYTDTNGTNGAWRWLKRTGAGTTGWWVVAGDTGWRDISADLTAGWVKAIGSTGTYRIRRVNETVNLTLRLNPAGATIGTNRSTLATVQTTTAVGFRSGALFYGALGMTTDYGHVIGPISSPTAIDLRNGLATGTWAGTEAVAGGATWSTTDAWPTTLPGV